MQLKKPVPQPQVSQNENLSKSQNFASLRRCAITLLFASLTVSASVTTVTEFSRIRTDLRKEVKEDVLKTLNGPDGAIFIRKSEAFFQSSLKAAANTSLAANVTKSKMVKFKANPKAHLDEIADKITELLMADALVGDEFSGRKRAPATALTSQSTMRSTMQSTGLMTSSMNRQASRLTTKQVNSQMVNKTTNRMNTIDVSQLDILIRDPNFQILATQTVQTVQKKLEEIEKNFPDSEAKTRFSRISCSDPSLHGGLTEYSLYDSETQTLEFCSRYLPMQGDLTSWEANLSPNAEREPASTLFASNEQGSSQNNSLNSSLDNSNMNAQSSGQTLEASDEFKVAIAPDETIASTDTSASAVSDNGALNLHPGQDFTPIGKHDPTYAGGDDVHRGPASLNAAEKLHNARLAKYRTRLPSKAKGWNSHLASEKNGAQTKVVVQSAQATPERDFHATSLSSVSAVSGQLTSNIGIRRSQLPASVHEGFEFRLQYGRLITTFWVVNRGTNYDLVYANSSGSRVTIGIPVTSFSYLQETAEAVHHDVNDISRCPAAKIQMHIVSEGEKEQSIAACVQGNTKAAADLRAMGNLLSTLVR